MKKETSHTGVELVPLEPKTNIRVS